jgi:hypothetical protein
MHQKPMDSAVAILEGVNEYEAECYERRCDDWIYPTEK